MSANFGFIDAAHTDPDSGRLLFIDESDDQLPTLAAANTVSPLADRGCLLASGPDTHKLLQGQFTCDITRLAEAGALKGAICDTKGRMFSSFVCLPRGPQDVLIILPRDLLEITRQTLGKYAVFYKCELEDTSDDYCVFGTHGPRPHTAIEGAAIGAVGDDLHYLVCPAASAGTAWSELSADYRPAGDELWRYQLIQAGEAEVARATSGEFIPQMLNFQHTGGVNFRKGCYTGQEIVARMQYLGKLKRRMYHLRLETGAAIVPGDSVDTDSKSAVGHVVASCRSGDTLEVLAVLTANAADSGRLTIGDFNGPVSLVPLPYDDKFASADK